MQYNIEQVPGFDQKVKLRSFNWNMKKEASNLYTSFKHRSLVYVKYKKLQ